MILVPMTDHGASSIDSAGVRIRDAGPRDHEFVLGLVPQLHAFGPPGWRDPEQMAAVDERVITDALEGRSPSACVLVAETTQGEQVGFIHLCEEEDYYGGACGHVGDVVVTHEARGRGVGTALLEAGERWARARGYRMLTLNVFLDNTRARALYEELGFRPETVRHVKDLS
jgi:GNAT superfamily N-acetyltransferase